VDVGGKQNLFSYLWGIIKISINFQSKS
jgi:hypothetical protein